MPSNAANGNLVVTVGSTASNAIPYSVSSAGGNNAGTKTLYYFYDNSNRLSRIESPQGTVLSSFAYDYQPGGLPTNNTRGRMVSASNDGYTWHYSYDIMGRVNVQTLETPVNGPGGTHLMQQAQYGFDNEGRPTDVYYPGAMFELQNGSTQGALYHTDYDSLGRPSGLRLQNSDGSWNQLAANAAYNVANQLTGWSEGSTNLSRTYDAARGWMSNVSVTQGGSNLLNIDYGYNTDGQVTSVTDHVNGGQSVSSYVYDNLNRLTGANAANWTMSWTFDDFGNRTSQSGTGSAAPSNNANSPWLNQTIHYDTVNYTNRIIDAGFAYDPAGNLVAMPSGAGPVAMTYDVFDRLKTASGVTYYYDAMGRRIAKQNSSGQVTTYFYDMSGRRLDTAVGYFAGQRVGQWTDRTGSMRANSASVSHYYPYGEEITGTGNDTYKYAQLLRDSDSGLDYATNRYYASNTGRFITADLSIKNADQEAPQTWNGYAYSNGDPTNRIDPGGNFSCFVDASNASACPDQGDTQDACQLLTQGFSFVMETGSVDIGCGSGNLTSYLAAPPPAPVTEQCPLIAPTGNYTVSGGAVALFSPDMAASLSAAFAMLNEDGITPVITSGFRTAAGQAAAQQTTPYVAAQASWHQVGEAVDIRYIDQKTGKPLKDFGEIKADLQSQGLVWGGAFRRRDPVHFQNARAGTSPSPAQVAACAQEHPGGH